MIFKIILMCTVAIYIAFFSEVFYNFNDSGAWPGGSITTLGFLPVTVHHHFICCRCYTMCIVLCSSVVNSTHNGAFRCLFVH